MQWRNPSSITKVSWDSDKPSRAGLRNDVIIHTRIWRRIEALQLWGLTIVIILHQWSRNNSHSHIVLRNHCTCVVDSVNALNEIVRYLSLKWCRSQINPDQIDHIFIANKANRNMYFLLNHMSQRLWFNQPITIHSFINLLFKVLRAYSPQLYEISKAENHLQTHV